jgi:hypothetical protein
MTFAKKSWILFGATLAIRNAKQRFAGDQYRQKSWFRSGSVLVPLLEIQNQTRYPNRLSPDAQRSRARSNS